MLLLLLMWLSAAVKEADGLPRSGVAALHIPQHPRRDCGRVLGRQKADVVEVGIVGGGIGGMALARALQMSGGFGYVYCILQRERGTESGASVCLLYTTVPGYVYCILQRERDREWCQLISHACIDKYLSV
jgi:hypothetical protein